MSDRIDVLFDELSQITGQYQTEVPSGRRAWPVSIKDRVRELRGLGLTFIEISKRSRIPIATIYSWKLKVKASGFLPVKVVTRRKSLTVTVRKQKDCSVRVGDMPVPTVTVVTPAGMRIEGLRAEDVLGLLSKLENGGRP